MTARVFTYSGVIWRSGASLLLVAAGAAGVAPSVAVAAIMDTAPVLRSYDIPAQPLESALLILGRQSGIDVLYERGALDGLRSSALRGRHTPQSAVATILRGTGLAHRFTTATAVLVLPMANRSAAAASGAPAGVAVETGSAPRLVLDRLRVSVAPMIGTAPRRDYSQFGQRVRAAITRQLQDDPRTSGRQFSARVAVVLDDRGTIRSLEIHRGTGKQKLDRDIIATLQGATMPEPPPADLPQPIWFEVVAR